MKTIVSINQAWEDALSQHFDKSVSLERVAVVGGASINEARTLHTTEGRFFVKINDAKSFPEMLKLEAKGLEFLAEHSDFAIPKPLACGESEGKQWIMMEHIEGVSRKEDFWTLFATRLADMHRKSVDYFGLGMDNYLGSLRQTNTPRDNWPEFFAAQRIEPQLKMAKDRGRLSAEMERRFETLLSHIEDFFPDEPPAAIHGDLWSGNFMTNLAGEATVVDPAVYFGHREMDIGMSRMFGGFDDQFYKAYHEAYPLEPGWEERIEVANLYPLLAHVNLFGGSYVAQVTAILRKYA